jgi:predicted transcriptional regulator
MSAEPMMTRTEIEAVFERVKTWAPERQEDAARILLRMEKIDAEDTELTEDDLEALAEAEAEADRGEFASQEEVEALFAKYRG